MNIEELILKGEELGKSIEEVDWTEAPPLNNRYKSNKEDEYQNWNSSAKIFIRNNNKEEYDEIKNVFEKINPENHKIILASLRAIRNFPKEHSKDTIIEKEKNLQNVYVYQNVSITLINEAFKSELNDNQRKEIKTIIDDKELEPEKKKSKIVETLKKFGGDVASNILANILTNPSFFGF